MKMLLLLIMFCSVSAWALASEKNNKWQKTSFGHFQGLGEDNYHMTLKRKDNNKAYQIYVRVPAGQKEKTKYPVVYLLDGGITFPMLSAHYHLLHALNEVPPVILVGVSYGTGDWQKGNNRGNDFTAPSSERDHWGGAGAFLDFLRQQVFPAIEKHFAGDPSKRILFGNSLGGQFGLYSALEEEQTFYGVIASNPAIHTNVEFYMQPVGFSAKEKTRLFIGRAENDAPVFVQPLDKWLAHWSKQASKPFDLNVKILPQHSHVSSIPDAFYHGMVWLLPSAEETAQD